MFELQLIAERVAVRLTQRGETIANAESAAGKPATRQPDTEEVICAVLR